MYLNSVELLAEIVLGFICMAVLLNLLIGEAFDSRTCYS